MLKGLRFWIFSLVVVWVFQALFADQMNPYLASIVMYAGVYIILAVSLNLVNGFTGQFSMGHAGFMSVGAYTSSWLTSTAQSLHPEWFSVDSPVAMGVLFLFLVSLLAGGFLAAVAGVLVGLPSLRLKGDYLAIVTLGFGEIIRVIILNLEFVGGARGMPNIPALANFGWVYSSVIITIFVIWRLIHSAHGRSLLAIREDEIAAEAMGVNTTLYKVKAFVIGAFFAGVAGGLFAHYLRYLNPQIFDFNRSFEIIIMVVLGGMGSLSGSVVAAIFLTFIREALRPLQKLTQLDFRMIIYSLLLITLMLTRPRGLFGTQELPEVLKNFYRRIRGHRA